MIKKDVMEEEKLHCFFIGHGKKKKERVDIICTKL